MSDNLHHHRTVEAMGLALVGGLLAGIGIGSGMVASGYVTEASFLDVLVGLVVFFVAAGASYQWLPSAQTVSAHLEEREFMEAD